MNKSINVNGIEFYLSSRYNQLYTTYEPATTKEAEALALKALEAYVGSEIGAELYEVVIDTKEGEEVSASWACEGMSIQGDEYIIIKTNGERRKERARDLYDIYKSAGH